MREAAVEEGVSLISCVSASQQRQGWIDRKETPYKKYKGLRIN